MVLPSSSRPFHDFVDEGAHGVVGFVDEPFVQDEELVGGEFSDQFRASHGFVAGDDPLLGEVWHAHVSVIE